MSDLYELATPRTVFSIGRKRTKHLPRLLIQDDRVVYAAQCGIDPLPDGFTETTAYPTCEACIDQEARS